MKHFLILAILLLAAYATYLWFEPTETADTLQYDQELLADYIAQDITRTMFDKEGYVTERVQAKRLEHFELLGFTQFEKPVYSLFNEEHLPTWKVSSQYAVWFPEDKVILEKDVLIVNQLSDELIDRIETSSLEMHFPDNTLATAQPILVTGRGFYMRGIGLRADLTNKTLQIVQHEETVYLNEN